MNNTAFDDERDQCLSKLLTNTDDKSRAGRVDQDIISFLDTLNTKRDYFTNSSCAGRIILVQTSPSTGYLQILIYECGITMFYITWTGYFALTRLFTTQ